LLALDTEALFESQQRLLGEKRGRFPALCAIGGRPHQRAVLFRGLKIKRARHNYHLTTPRGTSNSAYEHQDQQNYD
jgi:hypothetical protein